MHIDIFYSDLLIYFIYFDFIFIIVSSSCQTKRGGAQFVQETLKGLIKDQVDILKRRFGVQFIVNCTGLGSAELAGDKNVYPLRGECNKLCLCLGRVYE